MREAGAVFLAEAYSPGFPEILEVLEILEDLENLEILENLETLEFPENPDDRQKTSPKKSNPPENTAPIKIIRAHPRLLQIAAFNILTKC